MKLKISCLLMFAIVLTSCKKDPTSPKQEDPITPTTGSLKLEFDAVVDTLPLTFNTVNYVNAHTDTFKITTFKYYISNVVLTKDDNSTYTIPDSYYLIDHNQSNSFMLSLPNIPLGNYKAMTFMIGVDSARNVSGVQSGDLDPAKGMFWSWSSGYIMAKFEGTSPQSEETSKQLIYHVGGFSGVNNTLKTVSPSFNGETANVTAAHSPEIHIEVDISEWFKSPANIDFSSLYAIHMPGVNAKKIADNYADMFSIEHIHND